jgi:hypothetical protein
MIPHIPRAVKKASAKIKSFFGSFFAKKELLIFKGRLDAPTPALLMTA